MASTITVDDLVVAPGVQQTYAQWTVDDPHIDGLPYLQLDRVELWAHTSNDRSGASKVAEGVTFASYVYSGLAKRYHWIRARDREGQYSDWYPSSSSAGVVAGGVWQEFDPALTPLSGSFTTLGAETSLYYKIGPNVTFNIEITITTNGTAADGIAFTPPVTPSDNKFPIFGTKQGTTALAGIIGGAVYLYDGSYPGGDGAYLVWSCTYEADE